MLYQVLSHIILTTTPEADGEDSPLQRMRRDWPRSPSYRKFELGPCDNSLTTLPFCLQF